MVARLLCRLFGHRWGPWEQLHGSIEHRYCGYCGAKSAWGDTPLAHYNKCAFVVARALLGLRR